MTITIFGATGTVGKELVKQALNKGYIVRAFGRNVFTVEFEENENLHLIQGALFDEQQVFDAINGSEAILSAIGGLSDTADKTRSLGMKIIVSQLQKANVSRIIAVGGMGILDATDEDIIMNQPSFPPQFMAVSSEHFKAYQHLKVSSLQWTMVCPPDIIPADVTGIYHTKADYPPIPNNNKINAGDLAMFMLNELTKKEYLNHRVGISN